MRKDKYIRVSTAMDVVLTGGCGECKLQRSEHCEGCRTQTIIDLLNDVAKTGVVEIPQTHGRLGDLDALLARLKKDPLFSLVEQYGISGVIEAQDTIIPAEGGAENE